MAGCGNANERICSTPPALEDSLKLRDSGPAPDPVLAALRQGAFTRSCVHRWAYRIAAAPDSATTVAKAVVAGCRDAKDRWDALDYEANRSTDMLPSNRDGRAITRSAFHNEELEDLALFSVVQARAGNCKAK
eukprot:gene6772-9150_t